MDLFGSGASLNHDPAKGWTKWNSAIDNCIIYTCAFPAASCQHVHVKTFYEMTIFSLVCYIV